MADYKYPADLFREVLNQSEYSFYLTQWIDYASVKKWRLKMRHDIKLKNGETKHFCWPNGNSFSCKEGTYQDDDVASIRICQKQFPWSSSTTKGE